MTATHCSISTISIPERKWTLNCMQNENIDNLSNLETYSPLQSNVSLFENFELNDQCDVVEYTLAIIKPSITQYMYKIENLISQKGFVIKKVILFFQNSCRDLNKNIVTKNCRKK